MFLRYGSYQHDPAECEVQISESTLRGPNGAVYAIQKHWDILGRLHADNQADVNAAIAAMLTAYSINNQDLVFCQDDGTPTTHALYSGESFNGTKVIAADFPQGNGGEFSTFRNYHIAVEGEFPYFGDGLFVSYEEQIQCRGTGGPQWGYLECLNGPPQQQMFIAQTVLTAVQRGSVTVAGGAWPQLWVPSPIWPANEHGDRREITPIKPASRYGERTIHWAYYFSFNYDPGFQYPT